MGFFAKLKSGLQKTRDLLFMDVKDVFRVGRLVDEELLGELEERLLLADVGPAVAGEAVERVRARFKDGKIRDPAEMLEFLKEYLAESLGDGAAAGLAKNPDGPTVILLVGVNGVGKTTSAAKLARHLVDQGGKVILAAADTFRAAAGEQLDVWAGRIGVDLVRLADGADPAAVVFDACAAAAARKADYVLVDTAGRVHTKANLMRQLEKIHRVAAKCVPGAPHEVLLVLDATTGQNALSQAKVFTEGVGVTGLILAKLDGTAKGGAVISISRQIRLPVKFIGLGEKEGDFAPFDGKEFCAALFAGVTAGGGAAS
ncbi:MAG: signal recognition particle-docking protein FtsY [Planctomycetota bacterium]|jgi:fused signal recognition particle receptor|nr:signal recognition particle-docking protein FtsY [Planctomycetota bacterium]